MTVWPKFQHKSSERRGRIFMVKLPHSRFVLPNLFTLAASFCGFALIWMAQAAETAHDFYQAALLVPVACILDGLDGRVARLVNGQSKFGMQLDSLSDAVTFGIAPAVLAYHWALADLGLGGVAAAFVFAACSMIRLARFNVTSEEDEGSSRYFQGLPAPMGGLAVSVVVAMHAGLLGRASVAPEIVPWVIALLAMLGLLMVSNVPFRTFKDLSVRRAWNVIFVVVSLSSVAVISAMTNVMAGLGAGLFAYITGGLLASMVRRRRRVRVTTDGSLVEEDDDEELSIFDEASSLLEEASSLFDEASALFDESDLFGSNDDDD